MVVTCAAEPVDTQRESTCTHLPSASAQCQHSCSNLKKLLAMAGSSCAHRLSLLLILWSSYMAQQGSAGQPEECLAFLHKHMPERDRGKVTDQLLEQHVALALQARQASAWAQSVPFEVFLNDVLPYRNLDEPLDAWRLLFHQLFMPLVVQAASTSEAAQLLNQHIWKIWGIHFKSDQAPEILSPSQVIKAGFGSCSALSIFLVNACRAVGVPARVAGTPSWVQDRRGSTEERFNNHNWVEVWDDGQWSFTGAAEFNPAAAGLNRTWFYPHPAKNQLPGDRMHAIYAASYASTGNNFPLAWAPHEDGVPAWDVTQAYLDAAVLPSEADTTAPTLAHNQPQQAGTQQLLRVAQS